MSEPNDLTELAGASEADTQSAFAWATEEFEEESPDGWLTAGRITGVAVGLAVALVGGVVAVGVLKLRHHEPAATIASVTPSPLASPSATMTTMPVPPPHTVAIAIPTADMGVYDAQFIRVMQNAGWTQDDPSFLATRARQMCSVMHQGIATPELLEQKLVEKSQLSMDARRSS